MTNEELALKIQAGETELMQQLWEQTEKFIAMKARRYVIARELVPGDLGGCEFDDLVQSGYFALLAAVGYYRTDMDFKFVTVLNYTLRDAFAKATGMKNSRTKRDRMRNALSLDAPIGEDADSTMVELIPDMSTIDDGSVEERCVQRLYNSQLSEAVESGISRLPERQQKVIRMRYFECLSWPEIASRLNITVNGAQEARRGALRRMYQERKENSLYKFVEERTNYFFNVGRERFQSTRISAVEEIVLSREKLAESWIWN